MKDHYITNPSAQQGKPMSRKGSVKPANIEANSELPVPAGERIEEGPVAIPERARKPSTAKVKPEHDTSPRPMGEKIGR